MVADFTIILYKSATLKKIRSNKSLYIKYNNLMYNMLIQQLVQYMITSNNDTQSVIVLIHVYL